MGNALEARVDGRGVLEGQVGGEPGHRVRGGLDVHAAVLTGLRLAERERLGGMLLGHAPEPAAQRRGAWDPVGVRAALRTGRCGDGDCLGNKGPEPFVGHRCRGVQDRPRPAMGEEPCIHGIEERTPGGPGQLERLGDHGLCGAGGQLQGGRDLGGRDGGRAETPERIVRGAAYRSRERGQRDDAFGCARGLVAVEALQPGDQEMGGLGPNVGHDRRGGREALVGDGALVPVRAGGGRRCRVRCCARREVVSDERQQLGIGTRRSTFLAASRRPAACPA